MFTSKHAGIILIIIGLVVVTLAFAAKTKEDFYIESLIEASDGVCILENGYCLHEDRNWTGYIVSWTIGISSILIGLYLIFFEKSYEKFQHEQKSFAKEIKQAKKKDEFAAYLAGFSEEEQIILKAVHEQDGIKQSTLRYRTGMSKSTLSLLLNSLENRDTISRKISGKTKEVYLRKKF
ncbi:MAG: hypothetical protein ABH828_04450 [archaeon]